MTVLSRLKNGPIPTFGNESHVWLLHKKELFRNQKRENL